MPKGDIALPKDTLPETPTERLRRVAIAELQQRLGGEPDAAQYSVSREPTDVLRASQPREGFFNTKDLVNDPQGDLAVVLMQRQYPKLFKNVGQVWTGAPQKPGIGGFTTTSWGPGGALISLGHSRGNLGDVLDTLRHELGHVAGLEDTGRPNAYDVSAASADLHRDIRLPSQTGRVALPGHETKQTELEQWYEDRELEQRRRKIQNVTKK